MQTLRSSSPCLGVISKKAKPFQCLKPEHTSKTGQKTNTKIKGMEIGKLESHDKKGNIKNNRK